MAVNPLPPQAYTKETLSKAYSWLLTQNSSIKEMASTQDMLISLYLKAQRGGEAALETPSILNFKQELKSLANLMGDLQTPNTSNQAMPQNFTSSTNQLANHPTNQPSTTTTTSNTKSFNSANLDLASLNTLSNIKMTLNLSSETEALRALIALGYKQFKKI